MSIDNEHLETINHLLDALEEARIFAGAEFETCCNEHNYNKGVYFSSIRDTLTAQINVLEDYKYLFFTKNKESNDA